ERRREQRGDDRGSDRGPDGRRPSPRWHAARRVRDAMARRRRRALGARCAHQEARGPILRERPAPGGGDGPHRTTSDGARDPMSAPPAPVRGEGLIDAGGIDGGTDGFPVSRRRLGGRPPGDDPEEGAHLPPLRLRPVAARSAPIPVARPTARRRFRTIDFGDNVDMGELEVTAHPAGHIPGATMYEVNGAETSLFTGDLHTLTTDLVWGAKPVPCDTLFIESTYAGRQHPERLKSEHAFLRKIEQVVNRGGLALVPSFAVGRTQDVILTLAKARHEVWLDGMGKKVNSIYVENPEYIKSVKALRKAMHHVSVVRGPRDSEMAVQGE